MSPNSEDMYDDSPMPPAADRGSKPGEEKEGEDGKTSILPRSFFTNPDLKPGDKCDIEIVAVHENDVEVMGCAGKQDEEEMKEGDGGEMPEPAPAPGGMSSMME